MKRILSSFILYACMSSIHATSISMDSLVNELGKSKFPHQVATNTPTYPLVNPITSDNEMAEDLMMLRFSKVETSLKKRFATAKRKKESTTELDMIAEICRKGENGLRGIDNVVIVDSIVIDKQTFLDAYPLDEELGALSYEGDRVSYRTQLNGMVLLPLQIDNSDSTYIQIMKGYMENEKFHPNGPIVGIGIEGDLNYPFLMPDGQTLYFAARTNEGYGNYDLFVTRYDNEAGRFYYADNMGFPYNSYANDYMLVIDENSNLGWFASDRYQPNGKVCIYTFIPNKSRHTIDYENTPKETLLAAASLHSLKTIHLTDEQQQKKLEARKRITNLKNKKSLIVKRDFEFVINDRKTCHTLSDFTNSEAKKLCGDWLQKTRNLTSLYEQLEQIRATNPDTRQTILNIESRIIELQKEIQTLEKKIRRIELGQ
ncbi:MAG: hypothetical protein GXY64_05340 [Bacteroidales bacterium]|nr:hypothetical protein [Bacteroidales bacterium]